MQPENQQPDYSFILNPDKPKKSLVPSGGGMKRRLFIAGGGLAVLILLIGMLLSIFSGDSNPLSLRMAQQHTELLRITEIGEEKARGQVAKNLATTTRLTLASSEQEILAIASSSQKINKKVLSQGQDPQTDKVLTEAEQRSRFDEVFTEVLSEELEVYRKDLQSAHNQSGSEKNKQLYSELYDQLGDIIDTASGAQQD